VAAAELPAPGRILVINVTRIGDTLLATPAVRALAKAWPRAEVTVLAHPKRVEVIHNLPFVAASGAITKHRARWRGWLGGPRWDLALVYGFDRPLVAYALRTAERVVAFRQGDAGLDARLYRAVERPPPMTLHAARAPLLLTAAIGVAADGLRLAYVVTPAEKSWARAFLAATLLPGDAPLVGLQIAGFHATRYRDWPVESFAALGERMVSRWPRARLLLFGGQDERTRTTELAQRLGGRAVNLAGRLTLRESAALMDALDLYIGVDTGPTHIMSALAAPMVAMYHCHSPGSMIGPLERPRSHVVEHPRAAPCGAEVPMAELPVDAVWKSVLEALPGA
jgi:heptosyltransferase-3